MRPLTNAALLDLYDTADAMALNVGDFAYDLELDGLGETEVHQAVTEARNALNRATLALGRRVSYTR